MKLLLMRHGEAGQSSVSDFSRTLTGAGRADVRQCAQTLVARGELVEKFVVSPYVRTRETASLMAETLGEPAAGQVISDQVTPGVSPAKAASALTVALQGTESGLVVMHQPLISGLIKYLTGEDVPMSPGNLAILDAPFIEAGCCHLICVL